jgi:Fe-S-cluster containining protein
MQTETVDQTECVGCKAPCCRAFYLVYKTDRAAGRFARARKRVLQACRYFERIGPPVDAVGPGQFVRPYIVQVPVRCTKLHGGRCAIYADRPQICREFPGHEYADCPLSQRLAKEPVTKAWGGDAHAE